MVVGRGTDNALQVRCAADSGMHICVRAAVSASVWFSAKAAEHIPRRSFSV